MKLKVSRLLVIFLFLPLLIPIISCQSSQTKTEKEIYGKWVPDRWVFPQIWFYKDNTFRTQFDYSTVDHGTYSVNGKTVIIKSTIASDEKFRLAEDHCLYAPDGTKYIKAEEYESMAKREDEETLREEENIDIEELERINSSYWIWKELNDLATHPNGIGY